MWLQPELEPHWNYVRKDVWILVTWRAGFSAFDRERAWAQPEQALQLLTHISQLLLKNLAVCSRKHQDGSQTNGIDKVSATPFKYFDLGGDILGAYSRRRSLNKKEASSKLTDIFKAVKNDGDIFKGLCQARTGKLGFSCYWASLL